MTDEELRLMQQFEKSVNQLREWCPDYVIMARGSGGGILWKFSDSTWAMGACNRLASWLSQDDCKSENVAEDY